MKGDKEIRKLYKGETFGEAALYSEANRTMSVVASEDNVLTIFLLRIFEINLYYNKIWTDNFSFKNF